MVHSGLTNRLRDLLARALSSNYAQFVYIASVGVIAASIELGFSLMQDLRTPSLQLFALLVAGLPIAAGYAISATRSVFRAFVPARLLPRTSRASALSPDSVVLIVIPTVLSSADRVQELAKKLTELAAEHPEPVFRFALIGDFEDAPFASMPHDEEILDAARAMINGLNEAQRDSVGDRFFLLHRRREWSNGQETWMGWERKRGKLLELNRFLLKSKKPTTFAWIVGDLEDLMDRWTMPYVISIDERSCLDAESTWELICTASSPLNRPVIDEETGRVVAGYGIIQPTLGIVSQRVPASAKFPSRRRGESTPMARIFPFDPFGVGVHKGWGALYNVKACNQALDGTFPEGIVLHHDLLEGFVARTGETQYARVLQGRSSTYRARLARGHRWLRGIFQSLPWVMSHVRDERNRQVPNPLDGVGRSYVAELALMELQIPASLALIAFGWIAGPVSFVWMIVVSPALLHFVSMLFRILLRRLLRSHRHSAMRTSGVEGLASETFAVAFSVVVLAIEAALVFDAMGRTFWRMAVSQKKLLDWTTHTTSEVVLSRRHHFYWQAFWPSSALASIVLAAIVIWQPANVLVAAPITFAWIGAPSLVWLADRFVFDPQ